MHKQDALEQIVEDCLQSEGYFTTANVKYRPQRVGGQNNANENVFSDIDLVALAPNHIDATRRVLAVSCKSGSGRFPEQKFFGLIRDGGADWGKDANKHFRELAQPQWGKAFAKKIFALTGQPTFTYVLVVERLKESEDEDQKISTLVSMLRSDQCHAAAIEIWTFSKLMNDLSDTHFAKRAERDHEKKQSLREASDIGRLLSMIIRTKWVVPSKKKAPQR